MAATLVEGEVNVIQNQTKEAHRLKPGQQAVVSGPETQIGEVNVEQFVAWKNGRIYFENNSLEEILSNLERWYDVEVSFTDERLKALRFSIDVERYTEFNRVFEIIELTRKVKFNINENQIIVLRGN
jgi:ferric-dicitrate binding protein FerR (iron transport regulator)